MSGERKICAMHAYYGKRPDQVCATCCHFVEGAYHNKRMFKCEAYGLTRSEASDWRKSYVACGLYGNELPNGHNPLLERLKHSERVRAHEPVEGQMSMLEGAEIGG